MSDEIHAMFYISFDVTRNDYGEPVRLNARSVTKSPPTTRGDYCLKVNIKVPKSVLEPDVVNIKIESPQDAIVALQQTAKDLSKP